MSLRDGDVELFHAYASSEGLASRSEALRMQCDCSAEPDSRLVRGCLLSVGAVDAIDWEVTTADGMKPDASR